ncbi:hypothetical protein [Leptolyngbya iicbica]|uniref:Uncharacterized protein n=2 Tax=Cyanophyceae TaxID=3028117 RepID=A0A4Q7E8H5_9CYAN|nr:hypothetical protein [Leptolyngbya sp. LK]RZM78902.1 hypothetical protein DYY88_08955 [Leptolyngbya sp. LK]
MSDSHPRRYRWLRYGLAIVGAIAFAVTSFALPVQARNCYDREAHTICLERVQRSAKYHWRYRVQATVDGQPQPLTRYDCRDRTRTPLKGAHKGQPQKFTSADIGDQLCTLVNR